MEMSGSTSMILACETDEQKLWHFGGVVFTKKIMIKENRHEGMTCFGPHIAPTNGSMSQINMDKKLWHLKNEWIGLKFCIFYFLSCLFRLKMYRSGLL